MSRRLHQLVRLGALTVLAASLTYMAQRSGVRSDLTEEGLSQITEGTREVIRGVDAERPIVVTAYVSKEVPRHYVALRSRLLNVLREMEAEAGPGLTVRILEPEPHSEAAEEAVDKYGIAPRAVVDSEAGRVGTVPVFLGVAFHSGPREEVIPFFDRGLSVEYEVARALRVVAQEKKKVVGILRNDTRIMGNFDIQTRRRQPAWYIVSELEKQYEVRSLNPGSAVPEDVDVLIVPQVSSLSDASLGNVGRYLHAGRPALVFADPMPAFNVKLSPSQDMLPPPSQGGMAQAPAEQKGDYKGLLASIGVEWNESRVVWDMDNPNPRMRSAPRHVIFVGQRGETNPFEGGDEIVDGLNQVVTLFAGDLEPTADADTNFEPLLVSGANSGWDEWSAMTDDSNFLVGLTGPIIPRQRGPASDAEHVLGVRVTGGGSSGEEGGSVHAIVLSDIDMMADSFFGFHQQGGDIDGDGLIDVRFDNVTFLLNCIDSLAGDDRFIGLRKRQPTFRRLERVDAATEEARNLREEKIGEAEAAAEASLNEAQQALEAAVAAIRDKPGLDEQTRRIMMRSAEEAENRRVQRETDKIQREKERKLSRVETEHLRAVDEVQNRIRLSAVLAPPIPAILLGLFIFARRRTRERSVIPKSRQKGSKS